MSLFQKGAKIEDFKKVTHFLIMFKDPILFAQYAIEDLYPPVKSFDE